MNDFEMKLKDDITVKTVSKAIVNETSKWDFKRADYISLVNDLLDQSLIKSTKGASKDKTEEKTAHLKLDFPLRGKKIQIRLFDNSGDYKIVHNWLKDDSGRWFLLSRSSSSDKHCYKYLKIKETYLELSLCLMLLLSDLWVF